MSRIIYFVIILLLSQGALAQLSENTEHRTLNAEQPTEFSKGTQAMIDRSQINGFPRSAQNELEKDILITAT
jgi:hypothetical protein